ncbi:hypothetical protein [Dactylosporangium darangshiense]|uniref:hypothetical protein n=1 Tax=Dactylosporangium darangshiense TaxID=579108 RepID=UPI003633DF83
MSCVVHSTVVRHVALVHPAAAVWRRWLTGRSLVVSAPAAEYVWLATVVHCLPSGERCRCTV